jgi:phage terminase Nu1 subunit (DNA packaging protein)
MRITGQERIAEAFGVTYKAIIAWQDEGMPVAVRGGAGVPSEYVLPDCIAWHTQREIEKANAKRPRDQLAQLQVEELQLRLAERRRELVPAAEIEPMWDGMVAAARAYLRSEVNRLAELLQHCEGNEARRDLLAETFDAFLRHLAGYEPGDDTPDATTAPHPREEDHDPGHQSPEP